ncbi:MAG TPA: NAD-dependent epimerase/dehydratase family protein [Gemmatimonadaceae bacterium]|jgi:UDP-glucose 4-epimerase|nr:NAD-dependent epimerase/dehydratase family protein [Gemmatimonadaceae bacterium]
MRVLITGGAGFIGSHLTDVCLARGDEVFVLDDLSTGSIDNIEYHRNHPYFHYTIGRVQNASVTAELVDRCDVIYHLAAEVGVRRVIDSPISTIENNVQATEVVFAAAAKKGKRVLFTSTSEVYGLSTDLPYREDGNIVMGPASNSRWSYACSKALDEFLALAYFNERQMPVTIVRLFNTVGPRQTGHYGMVVPTLVQQAMTGKPLTVFGDGRQSRCFGFVKDVVRALVALMDRPEAAGQIYNVGAQTEISILELAQRVKELTQSASPIVMVPYEDAYETGYQDMPRRIPDTSKLKALVGFAPTTDIDEIVDSVMRSFVARQERSAPRVPTPRVPVRVA